jgi:molybdate transport system ATP-binding protein
MLFVNIDTILTSTSTAQQEPFHLKVSFQVSNGITVLFGPSGSGKSTTLAAIAGLITPQKGCIKIGEKTVFDHAQKINLSMQKRAIGMVFQNLALFEHLTVLQNVTYGLMHNSREQRETMAMAMLTRWNIATLAKQYPTQLSGGERQRVALARALVTNPSVLLLDEPLSALDALTKNTIIKDLRTIAQVAEIPILLVTHDRTEALALGQSLFIYNQGSIIAQGTPLAVLNTPRTLGVATLIGMENIFLSEITNIHAERGTMSVLAGKVTFEVPFNGQVEGSNVHIAISARDILLATEKPQATSARNLLYGRITRLQEQDLNLSVTVDCGIPIVTLITKSAATELTIEKDLMVWLAFKAHSCYILNAT